MDDNKEVAFKKIATVTLFLIYIIVCKANVRIKGESLNSMTAVLEVVENILYFFTINSF